MQNPVSSVENHFICCRLQGSKNAGGQKQSDESPPAGHPSLIPDKQQHIDQSSSLSGTSEPQPELLNNNRQGDDGLHTVLYKLITISFLMLIFIPVCLIINKINGKKING